MLEDQRYYLSDFIGRRFRGQVVMVGSKYRPTIRYEHGNQQKDR